jgi:hypothetical protein
MTKTAVRLVVGGVFLDVLFLAVCASGSFAGTAQQTGDECRKEICDAAVSACMQADLTLNPLARTTDEKKAYCAQFFPGCMTRTISPNVPWYSPEVVVRFMKCPS